MAQKHETGRLGEDLACKYLQKKGYKIIERNFRTPFGELDIVTKTPDETLVFVEVKTIRKSGRELSIRPEDNLISGKMQILKRISEYYANSSPHLIHNERGWRIDLLALTIEGENCVVKHYENIG